MKLFIKLSIFYSHLIGKVIEVGGVMCILRTAGRGMGVRQRESQSLVNPYLNYISLDRTIPFMKPFENTTGSLGFFPRFVPISSTCLPVLHTIIY